MWHSFKGTRSVQLCRLTDTSYMRSDEVDVRCGVGRITAWQLSREWESNDSLSDLHCCHYRWSVRGKRVFYASCCRATLLWLMMECGSEAVE